MDESCNSRRMEHSLKNEPDTSSITSLLLEIERFLGLTERETIFLEGSPVRSEHDSGIFTQDESDGEEDSTIIFELDENNNNDSSFSNNDTLTAESLDRCTTPADQCRRLDSPIWTQKHNEHCAGDSESSKCTPTKSSQILYLSNLGASPEHLAKTPSHTKHYQGLKRRLDFNDDVESTLNKDYSHIHESIKTAISKGDTGEDLVGDFSRTYQLPTIVGKHSDLKSIEPTTVANLLNGDLNIKGDYKIIDCRYPYEFDGGHIEGALNLYTMERTMNFLKCQIKSENNSSDTILIFHCEFSSERGPKRARFLRNLDRKINAEKYPSLNFPEIYIMDGGYKAFYEEHLELCTGYIPMLDKNHKENFKKYSSKTLSWS